jgi:hypothetical protein
MHSDVNKVRGGPSRGGSLFLTGTGRDGGAAADGLQTADGELAVSRVFQAPGIKNAMPRPPRRDMAQNPIVGGIFFATSVSGDRVQV